MTASVKTEITLQQETKLDIKAENHLNEDKTNTLQNNPGGPQTLHTAAPNLKNSAVSISSSLLTSSPFNTVSPPNKTVSDTYELMNETQEDEFDEALILAAAAATEEDITSLVTPLLS